ncbi:hypothetical protein ACKZDW_05665 (plasmid) [Ralstonia syzygii subsp. celebesensis]|uniref:Secreted protein n=4 Tax=Ralstonia solanacearum species complex TaxID=3116862 RepID=A0AAD0S5I3_RALSL|nr:MULTISPECIES: hypothetical protein [Ralstonia solanacearum species complex]BEU71424.1 hypothetical protein MAFF211271_09790 [Ralstonia pseudosolanacearum]AMP36942.1 hypothetical protein LBM2029_05015 [Ralstonia solanacearum]AQW31849.1 hypothetical protein B0B51_18100 [blood disease bacterium A2-HR MARDI]AXV76383.1 hypothetical protein CJO76_04990 [Ralstonia solanacearum]AXV80939.1 hypothetical protein CJO77_04910 [Ralstonia solanacearum]
MLNKTVVVPVLSAAAMAAFTVWALLVGPPDAAHAGERAVASHADAVSAYCATPPKTATR